jgi:hypothetical protein
MISGTILLVFESSQMPLWALLHPRKLKTIRQRIETEVRGIGVFVTKL